MRTMGRTTQEKYEEAAQWIRYEKNPSTKIATITFDRPEMLHGTNSGMRRRYAEFLFKAGIDDDVKVVVIRSTGNDFGTGGDITEMENQFGGNDTPILYEYFLDEKEDVKYPSNDTWRYQNHYTDFITNARSGNRPLQQFKKISILEVKGYCYGWHFYQAADADLVIASDDALFGHAAFRYAGWGPRMWTWCEMMGMRKFKEMLFTGRPFTAKQMEAVDFLNSVVPRDQLEAETAKFAKACSLTRPTDTVVAQKTFFEMYAQYRGEYMGAMMSGIFEGTTKHCKPDAQGDAEVNQDTFASGGLNGFVKDADMQYPPEFRLSRSNRRKP